MNFTLAIDQGTHASRAIVYDARGTAVASHLVDVALHRPGRERAEQDPERILDSVRRAVARTLAQLPGAQRHAVGACGLCTQRSTVLAWEPGGRSRSAALSWQDTRGRARIETLRAQAERIQALSGLPLSAHYGASKLRWLQQQPDLQEGLRMGPLAAFLLARLSDAGDSLVDHSNAQRMQLLDIQRLDWSPELAACFGVKLDALPRCVPVQYDYGLLLPFGVPIGAVCGDQNAAWFADAQPARGSVHVNIGSGAFVLAARQEGRRTPPGLLTSVAASDGERGDYLIEGTVNGAGSALHWLTQRFQRTANPGELAAWLQHIEDPPLFLNTVGGLGSPWWHAGTEPRFCAEKPDTGYPQRAVAVLESVIFLLQYNLQAIAREQAVTGLRVSGGLARLEPLCQKLADLSGLPVEVDDDSEASARGAAWLAAGRPDSWVDTARVRRTYPPQAAPGLRTRFNTWCARLAAIIETKPHE